MPDRLEGRLRWLFGGVAVVLVATGVSALLSATHAEPAQGGIDATVVSSVAALLGAALVVVLALATLVIWSPRRFTHLMPVFALANGAAALVLLGALGTGADGAGGTLLGVGLASVLALAAALGWLALWLAPRPGHATAARDAELLAALLATIVPAGEGFALGADDAVVRARIVQDFAARAPRRLPLLRIVLRVVDALSIVKYRSGFACLEQAAREALIVGLAGSRLGVLRALGALLDEVVLAGFYRDPRVLEQIGYDASWLRAKLDDGPNAAAHRARRDEAARLAAAAAAAALRVDDPASHADAVAVADAAPAAPVALGPPSIAADAVAPAVEELPFDRSWTLGVPSEPASPSLRRALLRSARTSGPTRP